MFVLIVVFFRRFSLGFFGKGLEVKACPNSFKENLSRPISWTTGGAFVVLLNELKLVDGLADICRAESTLAADVLDHGLTGGRLSKIPNRPCSAH